MDTGCAGVLECVVRFHRSDWNRKSFLFLKHTEVVKMLGGILLTGIIGVGVAAGLGVRAEINDAHRDREEHLELLRKQNTKKESSGNKWLDKAIKGIRVDSFFAEIYHIPFVFDAGSPDGKRPDLMETNEVFVNDALYVALIEKGYSKNLDNTSGSKDYKALTAILEYIKWVPERRNDLRFLLLEHGQSIDLNSICEKLNIDVDLYNNDDIFYIRKR